MSRLQAAVFQVLEGFTLSDDVRKILEAAYYADDTFAQGRAAGLEEAVRDAITENMTGLYYCDKDWSSWSCGTMRQHNFSPADEDDEIIQNITDGVMAALSPTSSDAGKDDARDAALEEAAKWVEARQAAFIEQHGYADPTTGTLEFGRGAQAEAKREYVGELDEIAEGIRALSSLEVIGKGEKG